MRLPLFSFPLALLLLAALPARPESRVKVWVELRDKGPVAASPGRAFEDAPVYAPYLEELKEAGLEVSAALKWQNKASGWIDASRLGALEELSCVVAVEEMPRKAAVSAFPGASAMPPLAKPAAATATAAAFGIWDSLFLKTGAAGLRDTLAARGMKAGQGLRIAVMDADFRLGHQAFDSLYARGAIADQRDFVANAPVAVTRTLGASHGAMVLSLIAGDLPGTLQGLAPWARFLLYRTEDEANEAYVEEDYLAAALERAVDSGAQVINISLGYRYDFDNGQPNFPYAQMNGRTRPSSLAALGAARRGAIVVVAVGNEGGARFGEPTVTAPADADSVVGVGMATDAGARCSYSSTGPSFDGRIKPEVSSPGCTVPTVNPSVSAAVWNQAGTSLGTPLVTGVAALLRQLHPESAGVTAQRIRLALVATATKAQAADNATGFGVIRAVGAHQSIAANVSIFRAGAPKADKGHALGKILHLRAGAPGFPGGHTWDLQGRAGVRDDGTAGQGVYIRRIPAGFNPPASSN